MILMALGSKHLHVTKTAGCRRTLPRPCGNFLAALQNSQLLQELQLQDGCNHQVWPGWRALALPLQRACHVPQRDNSVVAKLLGAELVGGVSPSVSAPRSIPFFHPLSLFAFFMAEEVPFHKSSSRRALGWTFCKVSPCNPFARGVEAVLSQGLSFCKGSSQAAFGKTCPFARVSLLQGLCKPATLLQGFPFARGERLTLLQGCPWQGCAFCKAFLYLFPKVCLLQGCAFCKACYTFLQRCAFCLLQGFASLLQGLELTLLQGLNLLLYYLLITVLKQNSCKGMHVTSTYTCLSMHAFPFTISPSCSQQTFFQACEEVLLASIYQNWI